ncbi:uncharacterized protein LOC141907439 [Tubulanus polymorphus]|uniref:uncharacterized protein LOC141907439 n=1 Tax=Tubulanus polymorphus TaxID=672921 RepID=UPI003DA6BA13
MSEEDNFGEGIIHTDNQALLSLLRDTTQDEQLKPDSNNMSRKLTAQQQQKKVYVDWPENSAEEEEFRFVSSRVEDYNDRHDRNHEYVLRGNSGSSQPRRHQEAPVTVDRDVRESTIQDDEETLRREAAYQQELKQRVEAREYDIENQRFPADQRRDDIIYDPTVPRLDLNSLQTDLPEESSGAPINISLRSPQPPKKKVVGFDTDSIDGDSSGDELVDSLDYNPHRRLAPPAPAKHLGTHKKSDYAPSSRENNEMSDHIISNNPIVGVYSRDSFNNEVERPGPRPQPRGAVSHQQPAPFVLHSDRSEQPRHWIDSNRYADENRLTNYHQPSDRYEEQPVGGVEDERRVPAAETGSSRYEAQPDSTGRYTVVTTRHPQQQQYITPLARGYNDQQFDQPQQYIGDQNYAREIPYNQQPPTDQSYYHPQQHRDRNRHPVQQYDYDRNEPNSPPQQGQYREQEYDNPSIGQYPSYQQQIPAQQYQQQQVPPQQYQQQQGPPQQYQQQQGPSQQYQQQQGPAQHYQQQQGPPQQYQQQQGPPQQGYSHTRQHPAQFHYSPQSQPASAPYSHNDDDLGIYDDPGSSSAGDSEMKRRESELSTIDLASELEAYQNRRQGAARTLSHDSEYDRKMHNMNKTTKTNKKPVPNNKPLVSNFPFDERPVVDYIEKNKQEIVVKKVEGSYNQAYKKRQTLNKQPTGPARRDSFTRKPPLPSIRASNSTGSIPDVLNHAAGPPQSAEEVWNQKMRDLQDQKRQKSSGKNKPKMFKKYNSDNRLNYQPEERGYASDAYPSTQVSRRLPPPGVQPRSYDYIDNDNQQQMAPPAKPVWNDNDLREQRVAVDINLKLMTPNQLNQIKQQQQPPPQQPPPHGAAAAGSPRDTQRIYQPQQTLSAGAVERQYQYSDPYRPDNEFLSPRSEDLTKGGRQQLQTNPYSPLPPIPPYYSDPNNQEEEGYLAQFQKQKHHEVSYKPYSLNDYKKLQLEIKLGGLGPNLDNETHKEKLEKKLRQAEYARQLREKNLMSGQHAKPPKPRPKPEREVITPTVSKRHAAMEYAKTLQKPHSRKNSAEDGVKVGARSPKTKPPKAKSQPAKEETVDYIDLQRLLHQHAKDKENADAIRGTFRGVEGKA